MPQNPLLAQLEGLIEPAQTSWWPLAPGWWILALLLLITLIALGYWFVQNKKQNAYKKEALNQLQNLKVQQQNTIGNINTLLKQTAITAYGREVVSRLTGKKWVDFLLSKNPKHNLSGAEQDQLKIALCESLYTPQKSEADENLYRFAQNWIKHHQRINTQTPPHNSKEAKHA